MTALAVHGATAYRSPSRSTGPARDPWFDSAKMLLVTLVVVGHSWTLLPQTWLIDRGYNWLYLWHVPAFVLVTGYLSRRFTFSRRNLRRLMTQVVFPYVVFEGLLAMLRVHVGGEKLERLWLNPHWPLWYLVVLCFWRLATPAVRRLPHAFSWSLLISLAGGIVDVDVLDVNRLFGLLPFFVAGVLLEQRHLDLVRSHTARLLGLGVLAGGAVLAHLVESTIGTEWLYYRTSYGALGASPLEGVAVRGALIAVAFAMAVSVLAWIPRRGGWFSALGAGSLVVYLFHGFFVKSAEYADFSGWAADKPLLSWVLATSVSVLLALTLASRPVRTRLEKVITPAP